MTEMSGPVGSEVTSPRSQHTPIVACDKSVTMAEYAATYARLGWKVLPLYEPQGFSCSCGQNCGKPGKHPRMRDWQTASCDPGTVAEQWVIWPTANIGLRLDGLIVLDVDGPEGLASLAALEAEFGLLDPCARQRSGSGGWHYLFEGVPGTVKRIKFRPGLDLLTGAGCYVVTEPSLHATGNRYQWDAVTPLELHRNQIPLSVPPDWLLEAAGNRKPKPTARNAQPPAERPPVERIIAKALEMIQAGSGRNDAGLWFFAQLRDNGYSRDEAVVTVRDWVAKANEATPGQDRYTMREAEATLRSAYSKEARDAWGESEKESHADILLKLIDDFEYFKSGPANDAFVRMVIGDHKEVWKVDPKAPKVREVLTHRFLMEKDRAPSREALNTVVDTILAKCGAGPKVDISVRFARSSNAIYLDMADEQWRAIEITASGWRVVQDPPVLFRRGVGARPLPVPTRGGSLDALRPLVNSGDDSQWLLMLSWLVGTFQPDGAFTHLVLNGEAGTAKSNTSLVLLSMVDPTDAGLSGQPKDETDATVSALSCGVLGYDNLSGCRAEIADVFCRFSTGQGYRTRTFYENLGVTVAKVKLPIILNGIDSTVMRGDLLERSISLNLPRVTTRLTEQGVWGDFAILHASCLAALLDVVSTGLRNLPNINLVNPPRMSDFCTWLVACEPALPWKPGAFLSTYMSKMKSANQDLAERDSVAESLTEWAEQHITQGGCVRIGAKDLLIALNEITAAWPKDLHHWPLSPEALAHRLVRLAPVLRAQGIEISKLPRTMKARSRWEIVRTSPQGFLIPGFIADDCREAA